MQVATAPEAEVKLPAEQAAQAVPPVPVPYVPAPHPTHAEAPDAVVKEPAKHSVQLAADPEAEEKLPTPQAVQAVPPVPVK